jgi:plasmid maintenance system antidote protein VapI
MVVRLSKAFGGMPETWLAMQAAYDLARVNETPTCGWNCRRHD